MSPEQSLAHRAAALDHAARFLVKVAPFDLMQPRHRDALLDLASFIAVEAGEVDEMTAWLGGDEL